MSRRRTKATPALPSEIDPRYRSLVDLLYRQDRFLGTIAVAELQDDDDSLSMDGDPETESVCRATVRLLIEIERLNYRVNMGARQAASTELGNAMVLLLQMRSRAVQCADGCVQLVDQLGVDSSLGLTL